MINLFLHKRLIRLIFISIVFVLGGLADAPKATGQDLLGPVVNTAPGVADAADIGSVPASGIGGLSGAQGYYSCNQQTWGSACADIYSFGTFSLSGSTDGSNAPASGTYTTVASDLPGVAAISGYDASNVTTDGFAVTVTNVAGTADVRVISSDTPSADTDFLNGGAAFDLAITDQDGDPYTLNFDETPDGMGGVTGGHTLQDVADQINGLAVDLAAEVLEDPDNVGEFFLSVKGRSDDSTDFTVDATAAASVTAQTPGDPIADLGFDAIVSQSEATDASYSVTGSSVGDGAFTTAGNRVTIDGIDISLTGAGTATFTSSVANAGVVTGGAGNAGSTGSALSDSPIYDNISVAGTALSYSSTGGNAGAAERGGQGGSGGEGGPALVQTVPTINLLIFPPLTIPSTQTALVQGGAGGDGTQGGTGGIGSQGGTGGALDMTLSSDDTAATTGITALTTGGIGGPGGQGGQGGTGGNGANSTGSVQSANLLPVVVSSGGNIGGDGGGGGTGGNGGPGGAGGVNELALDLGTATVTTGAAVTSQGGLGGSGGQGGQGGSGGVGGVAEAYTDFVTGTTSQVGQTGGLGGTGFAGGTGGTGGLGGDVTLDNSTTLLTAGDMGLLAESLGGQGGNGGNGGQGGNGGNGGNGDGITNFVNQTITANGGNGGLAGDGGAAGIGGFGGTGGAVTVNNLGTTNTLEANTHAINARSLGGAGGTGGVGGTGGTGGTGGLQGFALTNRAFIPFLGQASAAGAGGNTGSGGTGGDGGAGGAGGAVSVTSAQNVTTTGANQATAIMGESLGGLGGAGGGVGSIGTVGAGRPGGSYCDNDGGGCLSPVLNYGGSANGSTAGASVGTAGDANSTGGIGGSVSLDNSGTVATQGTQSTAMLGVSMGGVAELGSYVAEDLFRLGAPVGAQSGGAGDVDLTNSGSLETVGNQSSGLQALTLGQGFDTGAASVTNTGDVSTGGDDAPAIVALARAAASGALVDADAGAVTVDNSGAEVSTSGAGSMGIWAESNSAIGAANNVTVDNAAGMVATTGSGSGGIQAQSNSADADAGSVSVDNTAGEVSVSGGGNASAILALSETTAAAVEAAGGITIDNTNGRVSSSNGGSEAMLDARSLSSNGTASLVRTTNVGGTLSTNNSGTGIILESQGATGAGAIILDNEGGDISTTAAATGMRLSSQATTNNSGAVSADNRDGVINTQGTTTGFMLESVATAGNSGAVSFDNREGTIGTEGTTTGFKVQSVTTTGNSGAVSLDNQDGTIDTEGAATGFVLESAADTGDAGAVSLNNREGTIGTEGTTTGFTVGSIATTGNSGAVSLDNQDGTIDTEGTTTGFMLESAADTGDAGAVTLDNRGGTIASSGAGEGVVLASRAPAGTAGSITVLNRSSITCDTPGCTALTLNSTGFAGGDILLENGGLIEGGDGGTAVALQGGNSNTIINDDSLDAADNAIIRTAGSVFDTVITGTTGDDTIQNLSGGTILGSINLGTGTNAFQNGAGSRYVPGTTIDLSGGSFSNAGTVSHGGLNVLMNDSTVNGRVTLTGDFTQTAAGNIETDLEFTTAGTATDFADFMNVTGTANLDGVITLNPMSGAGSPGDFVIPLVSASTLIDNGISIDPRFVTGGPSTTVTFRPFLEVVGNTLNLRFATEFAPSFLTPNQIAYATMTNEIQDFGVPSNEPLGFELLAIADETEYRTALDSLTGEAVTVAQTIDLDMHQGFQDAALREAGHLLTCSEAPRATTDCPRDSYSWGFVAADDADRDPGYDDPTDHTYNAAASSFNTRVIATGWEWVNDSGGSIGGAIGWTDGSFSVPDRQTSGQAQQFGGAASFAGQLGDRGYVKGTFGASMGRFDYDRVAMGRAVAGDSTTLTVGTKLELGFHAPLGLQPFTSVRLDRQHRFDFAEDEAVWGNRFNRQTTMSRQLEVGLGWAQSFQVRDRPAALQTRAQISAIREFDRDSALTGSPRSASAFSYRVTGVPRDRDTYRLALGFTVRPIDRLTFSLDAIANDADLFKKGTVRGTLRWEF